jgi:GTP-binding protein
MFRLLLSSFVVCCRDRFRYSEGTGWRNVFPASFLAEYRGTVAVPKVVIVGRPNVGKSSLLNWLAGRRVAVVEQTAGVTRDRVTYLLHDAGRYFELIDTGGIGIEDRDNLTQQIEEQIQIGIDTADLVLFVVDGKAGLSALDNEVAKRLRLVEKPKLLVVNKCDSERIEAEVAEFHRLTNAPLVMTSVKGQRNRAGLLEAIIKLLPPEQELEQVEGASLASEPEMKLAIVGRRNVGKSTFINDLADADRVIVSKVPGTTRDSIDVRFEADGKAFVAIDTPGVRRRKSIADDIEYYGLVRARRSIRRADVVLMFFDSQETISKVDRQLVDEIYDRDKPCIFVVNKWDRAADMTTEAWSNYLLQTFASMRHVPVAFITATQGRNVKPLINLAQSIFKQARIRVPTPEINKVLRAALVNNPPPHRKNRRPKIFFGTQVAIQPPTLVLKCNDPTLFDETWKRYLLGVLREELPFQEVPVRLYLRHRGKEETAQTGLEEISPIEASARSSAST